MIAKARLGYLRMSPRKAGDVIKLVRGKTLDYSIPLLENLNKKAAFYLRKLIKSALSNAESRGLDVLSLDSLYISRIVANPGPTLKRYRAASFGRAGMIRKRTVHIEIELSKR